MSVRVYYNENDPTNAAYLRQMIKDGVLPDGEVDGRSIVDVKPSDLSGFGRLHFFAGIGGWEFAAQLAAWPEDVALWTGSCPCQPFSNAGKQAGLYDERHLWPHFLRLIKSSRPAVVMGEQVASPLGLDWFDHLAYDVEQENYTCGAVIVPACAVNAPHVRERLYWVAHGDVRGRRSDSAGRDEHHWANAGWPQGASDVGIGVTPRLWDSCEWITGPDGRSRPIEPGLCTLVDGFPGRRAEIHAFGNAIVPALAAEVMLAFLDGGV